MTSKELFDIPVFTRNGRKIGKIVDIIVEPESQTLIQYEVKVDWKTARTLPFFGKTNILIHRKQVVRLTKQEMVVEDGVLRDETAQDLLNVASVKMPL